MRNNYVTRVNIGFVRLGLQLQNVISLVNCADFYVGVEIDKRADQIDAVIHKYVLPHVRNQLERADVFKTRVCIAIPLLALY